MPTRLDKDAISDHLIASRHDPPSMSARKRTASCRRGIRDPPPVTQMPGILTVARRRRGCSVGPSAACSSTRRGLCGHTGKTPSILAAWIFRSARSQCPYMSVVTLSDECPRWRDSQVTWAPLSSARFANVCLKLWNVRFSSVGPARGISAAAMAGYRCRRSRLVGERNGWPFMPGKTGRSIEQP